MKILKDENLEDLITDELTIVDYYADWCGPCKMLAVELEELKDIQIIKINTDEHSDLAQAKGVMSIPFVEIYKNKEVVSTFVGFKSKEEIEEILKDI